MINLPFLKDLVSEAIYFSFVFSIIKYNGIKAIIYIDISRSHIIIILFIEKNKINLLVSNY